MPEGFKVASAWVSVSPDTEGFKEELQGALDEAAAGVSAEVRVGLDISELDEKADQARATVDALDEAVAEPRVDLDSADLDAKADDARAKLDELDAKSARPEVTLESADLDAKTDDAKAKLDALDARRADPRLSLDTTEFDERYAAAVAKLQALGGLSSSPRLSASSGGGGTGGGEGGGSAEVGLAGPLLLGLGASMPGLGGTATGLGLLGLTGGMALGPVASALSAAHQASLNVGLTPAELASTAESNAVQNQQAQLGVTQAREQQSQDAVTSAAAIESAETNLASVTRNAAAAQVQALQSVVQAEQGVEQANYGLSEAQYNLTQAWVQAREQIVQLNDQLADSKLSVQAAQLAVSQAEYQQRLTDQNAYSTLLEREQASLAVKQAQQQLKDATDQQTDATYAANLANKQGVDGSQTVIQAKQGVVAATQAQADAQKQLAIAQQQLTVTEENNAAQVKQAQLQLREAEEQAAFQRMMDAQAVAVAERNVTNTLKEQQLQMAATKSTSNEAANQFLKDMSRLSPAGRAFVNQILGMKGAFKGLETTAQNTVLPGFSIWAAGIAKLLPNLTSGVGSMGRAISASFGQFGKTMQTPAAAHVLDGLLANGVRFAKLVLPPFAQFVQELGLIGSKKGAVDGIAGVLAGFGHGLTGLAASVGHFTPVINQFLMAAGHIIAAVGPGLGVIIGVVATALGPLSRYLNAHPNGTVVKVLGDIIAALLTMKLLVKWGKAPFEAINSGYKMITGLPGKVSGIAQKISGAWTSGLGRAKGAWAMLFGRAEITDAEGNVIPAIEGLGPRIARVVGGWGGRIGSALKGAMPTSFDAKLLLQSAKDFGSKIGGYFASAGSWFANDLPALTSRGASALKGFASDGMQAIGAWGGKVGSMMSGAGSAVASFVSGFGAKLATAATATVTWIAEQTVAAATFIAENVAEAAAATVAFVAENLATLGIIAGIALLVTAIIYLATHWKQVWADIEAGALWLWHKVLDPMWQGISAGAHWLYEEAIQPVFSAISLQFRQLEGDASWLWHNVFDPMWQGIEAGARGFVAGFKAVWGMLESVFKTPVNFLIETVYDKGIAKLWDEVVQSIGLGALKLPTITPLAKGGVLPGYAPGHDSVHAVLSPGEGVLVPEAVRAIGPGTVDSLNATYGGGRVSSGNHFAGGGIIGSIGHAITGGLSKAYDVAKIVAAVATGNGTALSNALDALISTHAAGNLGKMMTGLPKALISDSVKQVMHLLGLQGSGGGGKLPDGSSGAVGDLPQNWQTIMKFLVANGFTKFAAAGVVGNIDAESGGNPEILEIGGGGGGGLIQWTPYPPGYITGNTQADLMTQLNAILSWGGGPSLVNRATSASNAAQIYQDYYERPANLTASLPRRMASANAAYQAMGYDSGGWLMPSGMPVNGLGKPEAVLTPEESQAFVAIARQLTSQGAGGGGQGLGSKNAVINFYGTQYPNAEQMAAIKREMGLALSGT
jgi:hypothetical protein